MSAPEETISNLEHVPIFSSQGIEKDWVVSIVAQLSKRTNVLIPCFVFKDAAHWWGSKAQQYQ